MSVKVMAEVFEIEDLGPTQRLILLCLADHADENGRCYPSVSRLERRTGLKARAIQSNMRELEEAGYVEVMLAQGPKGCNVYFVRATPAGDAPRRKCTPAPDAPDPRRKCTPTPAGNAPKPSGNHQEPSESPPKSPSPEKMLCEVVRPETARDFIAHRKAMKKPVTPEAAKRLVAKLRGHPDPDSVFDLSIENGWQGVFPEKVKPTPRAKETGSERADRIAAIYASEVDNGSSGDPVVPLLPARQSG